MNWLRALFEAKASTQQQPTEWTIEYSSRYQEDLEHLFASTAKKAVATAQVLQADEAKIRANLKTGRMDQINRPHKILVKGKSSLGRYQSGESEIWDLHLISPKSKYIILIAKYSKLKKFVLIAVGEEAYLNKGW